MKNKLKIVSLLLIICLVSAYLCACKTDDNAFVIPEGGYDGSAVTIVFSHTMGANLQEVLDIYIEEFNEIYPNITIQDNQVGNYDDVFSTISTQLTANNQPNLAYCYPDHVAYYNLANAVITLDDLIASQIDTGIDNADGTNQILGLTQAQIDDFIEGYYNEGKQFGDGLMYCLPFSKSTEVLYYDKDFFDEHNLTVPTTWAEMKTLCARILEIDSNCIPLGYDSESNWFITMCEQYGSDYTSLTEPHYLFNNEVNRTFVEELREWHQLGYVTTKGIYGSYTSSLFINQDKTQPRSYMSIGSSAGAANQRPAADVNGDFPFEVGIAAIPQVDASNPKVISQGPSICIFNNDNVQEVMASWLFLKFMVTNVDFQAEFSSKSGYVPVLKSVSNQSTYKALLDNADGGYYITALSAKVCLQQVNAYFESPAFDGSAKAREEVGKLLAAAMTAPIADSTSVSSYISRLFEAAIQECEY